MTNGKYAIERRRERLAAPPPMIQPLEARRLGSFTAEAEAVVVVDDAQTAVVENAAQQEVSRVTRLYQAIANILDSINQLNSQVINNIGRG